VLEGERREFESERRELQREPPEPQRLEPKHAKPALVLYKGIDMTIVKLSKDPENKRSRSWEWGTIVDVTPAGATESTEHWLCSTCHEKGVWVKYKTSQLGKAKTHIHTKHGVPLHLLEPKGSTAAQDETPDSDDDQPVPPHPLPDSQELLDAIVIWIAVHHLPFTIIESPEFRKIIKLINPHALMVIPKCADTAKNGLNRLYRKQRDIVRKLFEDEERRKVSLAFDAWTSPNRYGMLSVVANWYNGKNVSKALLGLLEIDGRHNGTNLAACIDEVEQNFGLSRDRIVAHVGDNASNNGTTLDALGDTGRVTRVRCSGHTVNLSAETLFDRLEKFSDPEAPGSALNTIEKVRKLTHYLSKSVPLQQAWDRKFKTRIARDNDTRWNSTGKMVHSLTSAKLLNETPISRIELNTFLTTVDVDASMKAKLRTLILSNAEWDMLTTLEQVLKPFENCTALLEGSSHRLH
jgi:hypothetical protein